MKLVASTGGKGGTGKSTFAVLFSLQSVKNKQRVLLCDCDVECPNDYLLLGKNIKKPAPIYRCIPVVDTKKCVNCGFCSKVCRANAIFWVKNNPPSFIYDLCNGCGACWISCPQKAIQKTNEVTGESYLTQIDDNFWLITGRSKPKIAETGSIVKAVKERAISFARKKNIDVVVVDTAPGTHCNVIQALLQCEKAYVVTEPTPLGSHDAALILDLLRIMKIPGELVLNKADIGKKDSIQKIANDHNTPITIEIPYSDRLVKAYSYGKLDEVIDLL